MSEHSVIENDFLRGTKISTYRGMWRSDEDWVRIVDHHFNNKITVLALNTALSISERMGAKIDSAHPAINDIGVFRAKRRVICDDGKERQRSFYYVAKVNEIPFFPPSNEEWQDFYDNYRIDEKNVRTTKKPRFLYKASPLSEEPSFIFPEKDDIWKRKDTRELFGAPEGVDVREFVLERVDILTRVINGDKPVSEVLSTSSSASSTSSNETGAPMMINTTASTTSTTLLVDEEKVQHYYIRCLYLRNGYVAALDHLDTTSFEDCCNQAIHAMKMVGITTVSNARSVMRWNQQFRSEGTFPHRMRQVAKK